MTQKIPRSAIAAVPEFAVMVAAHAFEMKAWREHMTRVKDDEISGVTGVDRHWPHPRPAAHPLVEASVSDDNVADYEIVDDGPSDGQILRAKKDDLLRAVYHLEQSAMAAIVPVGKRRFLNLRENAIINDHNELVRKHNDSVLKSAATAIGFRKAPGLSAADATMLDAQAQRRRLIAAVEAVAAQAMHDIEDLTIGTIDAWALPKFPD